MADGKVIYEVRADDSKLDADLDNANSKAEAGGSKLAGAAKVAGAAIGTAFVAAGAAAIKFGSEFEQSMANASTLFGDANVNTDELNKKMLALSDSSGIAASELGDAFTTALSSGIPATDDMSEALSFLEQNTKLAKSGFTSLDTAVDVTTSVLNAYKMDVSKTADIHKVLQQTQDLGKTTVDELGASLAQVTPVASAMGVSFEQVGASLSVMTAGGLSTAESTTQLKNVIAELGKSGTQAAENLAAAAEGTEYAGMTFTQLMEAGVPLNEVLDLMGTYAADNGLSMIDMFGSIQAGQGALAIAGQNSEAFSEALAAMTTEVDVVGAAYDKVTGTSGEQFNKLLNELKNAAIELFSQLLPIIEQALPIFKTLIDELIPPLMEMVSTIMPVLVNLFNTLLPPLMDLVNMLLPPLVELFNSLLPPLIELLGVILPPLIEVLNILLEPLFELLDLLLPPLISLFDALKPAINALAPIIKVLAEIFSGVLGDAIKGVMPLIEGVIGILKSVMEFITGVFTGNWEQAWNGIVGIFKGIFNLIPTIVESVINGAIAIINGIIKGINAITGIIGIPKIPTIPNVTLPRFHTGGVVDFEGGEGAALLRSGEMVLTEQQQAELWRLANGQYNPTAPTGTPIVIHNYLQADFDADGVQLARVVLQNVDDAAAFM